MSSLSHHGIKGQKWGVRRFQNKDGTRTAAGKKQEKQNRLKSTSKDYASIRESLSDGDFKMLNYSDREIKYMREHGTIGHDHVEYGRTAHRVIQKDKNGTPVAYVDATYFSATSLLTGKQAAKIISIDLATRAGDEYRGKGHAIAAGKKMVKWFDTYGYKDYEYMEWAAKEENVASQKTAEKLGFKRLDVADKGWTLYAYEHKAKHTSIGGTMYIEGNTLILGDSSYLEHHGIRGQRWGVRRFQNRDGSLTNAGRKRLGYATKGAAQAVGKAFKAGVKVGGNAVKAAKAHHEKKEAEKIEKKKEKASKTRAGVLANKDLFSAKELKDLNSKFEEQDKLRAAKLKQGLEVVKAVGEVAKTAKQVGDAYQSITGKSILGHITETKNEKEAAAKKAEEDAKEQAAKDLQEARNKDAAKRALQANIDKYKQQKDDEASEARVKEAEKQGNKAAAKVKLAEYIDRYNQDKAAQEATKQMLKNQKLQENIDKFNQAQREKDAATLKATTDQGKKILSMLERHGTDADLFKEDYQNRTSNSSSSSSNPKQPTPPTGGNLMAQIKAAQAKLKKPNKNETQAEHKEAQKKLNALEKVADEYKAAANKPGADPAEVTEKILKKNKDILDDIKHMDFSDTDYLEHYGVRGMKWGKHLMVGKGGDLYEGTALGAGGGGGPMTEEERKKAEALKKKKAEEAAKDKEKAKEIGVSVKAYKNYSIDKNHLPGKHHYTTSNKLHAEASSSVAEAQAAERQAHMNRAKAASLMRKVNSSHMFDADGYHISQQRGDDRNEAKQLKKEAKQLDKASKKALKKFYKKRYKSDRERQKWQNSTSGKYHHMMRHYEIQNGTLFIDATDPYLEHHGVKGMKWGKHLMAGKSEAGTGGGGGEDDEKLKEIAKKAGMTVAEYRTKISSKIGGAASKVGEKVFSGTSPKEKKRVARKDQYLALPEQKKKSRAYDNKAAETRRARAEKLTRDSEIFNRAAEESKRKQNSALNKGNKREAEQHGKNANFAQDWAEEGRRGVKDWRTGRRTGKPVLRTDSLDQVKKQHDKTLSGKLDKARYAIQRGKQKVYNAAGRYDESKAKRKKKVKHFDDTNAVYTEGTRLVIHPKSITPPDQNYLEHHGILGQKWGVRRFQNKDGTRTAAGKKRYPNYTDAEKLARSAYHDVENGNYESAARKYLESNRMPRYDSTGKELPRKTDNECISSFRVEVEEMRSNALSDLAVRIDTERKLARGEHVKSIFENDPDCKKMISALKEWEEESLTTADQFKQVSNIMRTMTNDRKETDRTKSDTMRMETLQEHQIQILDEYDLWGHPEYNDNRYSW